MEHLKYSSEVTAGSCERINILSYQSNLSLMLKNYVDSNTIYTYSVIDLATKEPTSKCELNKLKKKERESLNPRTRKNSRWC